MKLINIIFEKPYIIMLFSLITFFIPPTYFGRWLILIIIPLFIISFLYSLIQRKWINLILSFVMYLILSISFIFWGLIKSDPEEFFFKTKPGNYEFFSDEIYRSTKLKVPKSLKFISKTDTIYFIGPGAADYSAECLYTGPKDVIQNLENSIQENKEFNKTKELDIFPTEVISEKNFKKEKIKSIYIKKIENYTTVFIAFDKDNTKFYYSVNYY